MHILQCMGSKFCVKFEGQKLTKFRTHTPQNMYFTDSQFQGILNPTQI